MNLDFAHGTQPVRFYTIVKEFPLTVHYGLVEMPLNSKPELREAAIRALGVYSGDIIDLDDHRH